jgi:radical SAM protein with 4Fe4S-binding SPASM domain
MIDLEAFLLTLENELFIGSGKSLDECDKNRLFFSYTQNLSVDIHGENKKSAGDHLNEILNLSPQIVNAQIEITSICNERCIHCYIPHENKINVLPFNHILNIFNQLSECNTVSLTLTGGEIFTHPDFRSILQEARKHDFSIVLLTNLALLKTEDISFLKNINLGCIYVSLYSMIESEHDQITQINGSCRRTLDSIELCINNDIPIQISCPIMKTNYKNLDKLLLWGKENDIGVQTDFLLMGRYDCSTDNLKERLSLEETHTAIQYILEHDLSYQKLIVKEKPVNDLNALEKYVCHIGKDKICIGSNGNIYPCPGWQSMILGNIFNDRIVDIWKSSEKLNFLRNIKKKEFPQCLDCENINYCSMCIGRNFNENNGNLYRIPKEYCDAAKLNRIMVEQYLGTE